MKALDSLDKHLLVSDVVDYVGLHETCLQHWTSSLEDIFMTVATLRDMLMLW